MSTANGLEVEAAVEALWREVRELSLGEAAAVEEVHESPSALRFLRDYVMPNKPCLIRGGAHHWPALRKWNDASYLRNVMRRRHVSVHFTPDGRADALAPSSPPPHQQTVLASAHVQHMPFDDALDFVIHGSRSVGAGNGSRNGCGGGGGGGHGSRRGVGVAYLQEQNGCLKSEYGDLCADVDAHVEWATEALGCMPDAVNLWLGNQLSSTWFHKDHYENIYAVVSGSKHFLLLPPTEVHRMYVRNYPAARYVPCQDTGAYNIELESPLRFVPWPSVDPYPPNEIAETSKNMFPGYFNGPKPFECTLLPGDMLYLPSMWFHHVRQTPSLEGYTIAINYWYDMQFDIKYAYYNFLQSLKPIK